jgi:glycosyltransferase involved in cell wall biosynthesis
LLVGNFAPDAQQSMLRFEGLLAEGLAARGHAVERASPRSRLARLARPYRYSGWPKLLGYADKFLLFPRELRRRARAFRPDLAHIVDHANSVHAGPAAATGAPVLATCHDLLQIRAARGELPEASRPGMGGRVFQSWILRHIARLPHAACVSEATRADLVRLAALPAERVSVVPNGLNHPFRRIESPVAAARLADLFTRRAIPPAARRDFLFHIGGGQWYKNRRGLLALHAALSRRLGEAAPPLLLAGKPLSDFERAGASADELAARGVHALGPVSAEELESLYSLAGALIFPSLAEGFGWPLAEAQACACAVFASDRAPLTEVGGEAAAYFDPADPESAAARVAAAWPERARLAAAGARRAALWSPERMLEAYETLYRRLLAHRVVSFPC